MAATRVLNGKSGAAGKRKAASRARRFDVGGVFLEQPFKVRRLNHFGIYVSDPDASLRFYHDLLGFKVSDPADFASRVKDEAERARLGNTMAYFMHHNTDHHTFVIMPKRPYERTNPNAKRWPEVSVNQITWQVGSLKEVVEGAAWFAENQIQINRTGRDMPGSNWHSYPFDPEGHKNEICYGMEQIGWVGHSKPKPMYERGFHEVPSIPQVSEFAEVEAAIANGVDLQSGYRDRETMPERYDVDGILLARPFKIVRHGPVRLFVEDMDRVARFYTDIMGMRLTEEVTWKGHRCLFFRCNTEHHSMALYPIALREVLGLDPRTTLMGFGVQLGNYRQLRAAIAFLKEHGQTVRELPPELSPGIDYSTYVIDPDGHPIQLYYYMEQVGWDGRPRPKSLRRKVKPGEWPEALDALPDTFEGEAFLGPWG
jgi:catechol 2,3-dioxygenase-like lactoylglutathione lyase family enzyme